jgi:hypothetical protein
MDDSINLADARIGIYCAGFETLYKGIIVHKRKEVLIAPVIVD